MRMVDSTRVETLERAECLDLLITAHIGRVVFTDRALPAIRPVRFTLRDDLLMLQPVSGVGPITDTPDAVLALEVDSFTPDAADGWFVVVLGRAAGLAIRIELVQGWRLREKPGMDHPE